MTENSESSEASRSGVDAGRGELWGEALLRKGDVRNAIAKFDAANDLAPHWGHLHLRRGEALAKLGKCDDAVKEFALAASLDLCAAAAAELRRVRSAR